MSNSIYQPRRTKICYTDPTKFRVGDEFETINGKRIYWRLLDLKA